MVKLSCLTGKSSTFVGIDILHKQQTTDLSHLYHIAIKKSGGSPYLTHLNPSILDFGISCHPKKNRHRGPRGLSSLVPGWVHEWNRRRVDVILWHKSSGQKLWMLYCYIYIFILYIFYYLLDVIICCYLSVVFLRLQKPPAETGIGVGIHMVV